MAHQGDGDAHEAVGALYESCYHRLVGVVSLAAASRSDAEECVQEAFIRLLGKWPKVAAYDDPEAWVRMVAFRLLSNRFRKACNGVRAVLRLDRTLSAPGPSGDRLDVERALATLTLDQRQAVVLHHLEGLDIKEVARILQVAEGTVKSRLHRARQLLAPLLEEDVHV